MPKISAGSVAEHRAAKHAALVAAGAAVLAESGLAACTPREVCERAGLSRSSFYDYFATKDDLLVAIAIDAFEQWDAEVAAALTDVEPGLPEFEAIVDATMSMAADGRHDLAATLREADLHPSRMEDLMRLHELLLRPLIGVLAHLGHPSPGTAAWLIHGALGAGITLVGHGADHRDVAHQIKALLAHGVAPAQPPHAGS
ncbi:TetR/AcrR family transcriptional regulator [Demequina globuliformis]|uniref:TetR/AcrR family transcriptional regulator n=1 Tax=Demequina globuliformis TaxID=676202 RepID=UPI0007835B1D|nr:TetR/AcrR family transcriptional regulator [Demequina globuliformis]